MNELVIDKKEELVMKLLHYFITERGYNPVIIRGVKDEIWLENLEDDYKIVRIVSGYIHNNEQFKFDLFKTKSLLKTIKKKTLSFKINALSIFVNLGDNVDIAKFEDTPNIKFANIHEASDLDKYRFVTSAFPDITKDMDFREKGLELFMKITSDINKKNEYLKSINIPADSKIVLYLGRLAEEKNIEVLLDHFKDFLDYSKRDDVYFILVGDGPLRKKYEKHASDLGISNKVRFVGKVLYEDSPFYYSLGDVFVSASVSETQGLTFLEAMASKKILLVKSDINLFELIQNGYNGYFYENSEEFCKKLGKILDFTTTYYSEVVFNALESLNKWGLETFYRKVEVVYNKAIKKVW